jgi:uncharacterized protein YxeA
MIDTLIILFSTGAVLFALVRVIRLDRDEPWFSATTVSDKSQKPATKQQSLAIYRKQSGYMNGKTKQAHVK